MTITGQQIIGAGEGAGGQADLHAVDPATGASLEPAFFSATAGEIDRAMTLAEAAVPELRGCDGGRLAELGELIATGLEDARGAILERCGSETGYPEARLAGEFARTVNQMRQFAAVAREGAWLDATIDHADPGRKPLPKPDVRRLNMPVGPVVVFGASNFPLALSAAGGDTASALMAGCPVVVKGHPSHPGTCELAARVIQQAVRASGFPKGTFSMLQGAGDAVGAALVDHPATAAVGFTGSLRGGRALSDRAAARAVPVPFFAEMGSVNPQFVLPGLLADDPSGFAEALFASFTLGNGQFCTNPGLVFVPAGAGADSLVAALRAKVEGAGSAPLLNRGIQSGYSAGLAALAGLEGVTVHQGQGPAEGFQCRPAIAELSLDTFEANRSRFEEEVFGPSTVVVRCPDATAYPSIARGFPGQLASSIHGNPSDLEAAASLVDALTTYAGRLVINGFPTGIEICHAMHHGGLYPAASSPYATSIGLAAISRWGRPVAFQDTPDHLLPPALQEANPLGLVRTVDGMIQLPANQPGNASQ